MWSICAGCCVLERNLLQNFSFWMEKRRRACCMAIGKTGGLISSLFPLCSLFVAAGEATHCVVAVALVGVSQIAQAFGW